MPDSDTDKKPALGLSLSQVVGGSLAAATAALLGSKLGTTGTIVGAALVSIISAVGGALYTASLRRTREVVVRTRELLPTGQWRTVTMPQVQDQPDGSEDDVAEVDEEGPQDLEVEHGSLWSRISWKPVAAIAAIVFLVAGALVTGAELATGHEATVVKVVRPKSTPTPTPTPTQQPTRSATSSTPSASPSGSATPSASPTESDSPSASPSATTSPTASPSATTSPSASPTP